MLTNPRPLFVVTGASGSGKTTLFPLLLDRLAGHCAVFDVNWLIDPLPRATPDGQVDWPSFRDAWLRVANGVAQNGLVTLLLGPFFPEQLDDLPGRAWIADICYLVLDCPPRRATPTYRGRPRWRDRDIAVQTDFARWLRRNLSTVIDTSAISPVEAPDAIGGWVRNITANTV